MSENVKRLREDQNLGLRTLATKLKEVDRPLTHSAIDQIEKGARRVDVDDLMALAAALEASPVALLMPVGEKEEEVEATGHAGKVTCGELWLWLTGVRPSRSWSPVRGRLAWLARSRPPWTIGLTDDASDVKVSRGDD